MADPAAGRWPEVSALLDGVLELPAGERGAALVAACGGDVALRAEAEALLAACETGPGFLDGAAAEYAAALLAAEAGEPAPEPGAGERIGPYRIVRELGRGGMGAVYLAERDDPQLRQRVAVKRVRGGAAARALAERFLEERQILATLEHPGIARLVDGGVAGDGVPWLAMEYVDGEPLDLYCDARRLDLPRRLELFRQVCDAVAYAHRRLVVHCDLKPANVLVTAEGRARLLDFGVARLLSAEPSPRGLPPMMTPAYASPEQRRGEPPTTAADVYALGILLARLLGGADPPLGAALAPEPVARARGTTPRRLRRALRGDLAAIVERATRPDPEARYASVERLAADLARHASHHPVHARPPTRGYRARRFLRRNRWGAATVALVALLVGAFGWSSAAQARRVAAERDRAQQVERFLLDLLQGADVYAGSGSAPTVRSLLDRGAAQLATGEVRRPEARAGLFLALGRAYGALGAYGRAAALLDSSYAVERALHGEGSARAAAVANQLADVLRMAGRYEEAARLYGEVLDARVRHHGPQSTEAARAMNGLAMVLRMRGRHAEAEPLLREALAIDRVHAAREPAALAQSLNNLGHVLRERGRLAASESLHRESLALRRGLWGAEHFEVSVALANLAGVLADRGDLAGADSLYRRAMELRRRLVGDGHPDLATDRAGYARLLHLRGEAAAAEALYRRALAVHARRLPAGHPAAASTRLGLGAVLLDRGRAAEAAPLLRHALAARRALLPPEHPQVVEAEALLARACRADRAACP